MLVVRRTILERDGLNVAVMTYKKPHCDAWRTYVAAFAGDNPSIWNHADTEAQRLTEQQRIIDNRIRSIKEWYQKNLDAMGKSKVVTTCGTMAVQNNPPSLKVTDENEIPICYLTFVPARYEVDKDAVKTALKAGEEVPGAHLEQGRSLRIR